MQYEINENVDAANRPADVKLDSPSQVERSPARWNVQPETASKDSSKQDMSKLAAPAKENGSAQNKAAPPTRRSTRSQPARKRKG